MRVRRTVLVFLVASAVLCAGAFLDSRLIGLARTADPGQAPQAEQPAPPTITFQGREIPNTIEEILNPKHTVLVVHELLNDFISVGGATDKAGRRFNADGIIQPVAELLAAARAKNVRVAHVRWTRYADGSTDNDPQRRAAGPRGGGRGPSNIEGTWGWEAPEPIKPAPGEWVLPKWRQDAFFSTQLDELMRWNGIKTMIIVGLGAEAGIVPTVTHAASLGYFPVAVDDCIVASDPTWRDIAMKFIGRSATIKMRKDIIDIWSKSAPRAVAPVLTDAAAATAGRGSPTSSATPTVTYEGRQIPSSIEEILNPKHTVLLVHEMLNTFVTRGGGFDNAGRRIDVDPTLEPMAQLIAKAREKKVRVAYVRWTTYADGSASADPNRLNFRGLRPPTTDSTIEGTWGWQIADAVKPAPGEWVLRKYRPDAFFATPLDTLMRWNGIKTLVIVGPGTEVGVLPTLMHAANLGYFRVAVSDLLVPTDPKRKEEGMRLVGEQAIVKTQKEVMDIWQAAKTTPTP
jgi:nicotinamidase-related amidase